MAEARAAGCSGVHFGVSDRSILRDDITGGHRQGPTVLAVKLHQVRAERFVDLPQIVRQSPAHVELSGDFPAMIAQNREPEPVLPLRFAAIWRRLFRDRDQARTARLDFRTGFFQRAQVEVAIRTPGAAIESDHERPFCEQRLGRYGIAVRIRKGELWRDVPGFQRAALRARRDLFVGGTMQHFDRRRRREVVIEFQFQCIELALQGLTPC